MEKEIEKLIRNALKNLKTKAKNFSVEHPADLNNGDYSTNVAMVCKVDPEKLKIELEKNLPKEISKIEIKNRFINFYLSKEFFENKTKEILKQGESWGKNNLFKGKRVMVEYTQPNPFKPFHIGHLMSNAIGESISRLVEFSGAKIIRANYQGDVGPHVAKAIYELKKNHLNKITDTPFFAKGESKGGDLNIMMWAKFIGECYAKGNHEYEKNEQPASTGQGGAKKEIDEINKKIYSKEDKEINKIYDWGRKITLEAFEEIYKVLGTKFDKYYFESGVAKFGEKIVKKNTGKIFENSDGAVVFRADKHDPKLHTRVFMNSQGLPTYETKELGLTMKKFNDYSFLKKLNLSIVITAIEQEEYMKVVQKAISLMHPKLEKKMKHIAHGMMRFAEGKMSSRKGNVITGESLIGDSIAIIREKMNDRNFEQNELEKIAEQIGISAIKYSILRSALKSDIVYDFEKSISFEGDSGPYLQYTTVRANSILKKAEELKLKINNYEFKNKDEITNLERRIYHFPEIVEYSFNEFEPHHLSTYLIELASEFNTFYNKTKILDENNKNISYHLSLIKIFHQTMKNGLWLLGISVPHRM